MSNNKKLLLLFISFYANLCYSRVLIPPKKNHQKEIPLAHSARPGSYPYLSGDTFRVFCDHIIDETRLELNLEKVKDGDVIFVNADYLDFFFEKVMPELRTKFILVTHNSIISVPGKWEPFLHDDKLVAWFGKNSVTKHPKMHGIPLGIANPHWPHGNSKLIDNIRNYLPATKDKLVYLNFAVWTNSGARSGLYEYFQDKDFSYRASPKDFQLYLKDLSESQFVLSPEGASIDCHRIWETLLVGSYPIIKSSPIDDLFEGLPVWIVKDWSEVNTESISTKFVEFSKYENYSAKLFADYWLNKIREIKQQISSTI